MSAASTSVTTMSSASTTPMYAVVVFPEEGDGVGLVPLSWMIGEEQCYWPPYKTILRFEKAVRYLEPPNKETWAVHSLRVIKKTDSYAKGRRDMARAEETSDIQTEIDEEANRRPKRKRTARKIFTSSSESSDVEDDSHADPPTTTPMVSQAPRQPDASHSGLTPTSAMQSSAPSRQTPTPARQTPAPARQTPAPARQAPARQTPAPARQTTAPARRTTAPARQTSASARQTPAPARQTPAPARQTTAPARRTTAPARQTSASARQTWASARQTSAPARQTSAPARQTSTPARQTTALTRQTSAPARQTLHPPSGQTPCTARQIAPPTDVGLRSVFTMLMELKNEQKAMHRQMRKFGMLLTAIRDEGFRPNAYEPPEDIKLPAENVEDLDKLEETLAVNGDFERYLINHLSLIGGSNTKECVRSMLSAIFTNDVGRMVNWMGGGQMQKRGFQSMKIRDVLQRAIRKNLATSSASNADIQRCVIKFLKGAADRAGRRRMVPEVGEPALPEMVPDDDSAEDDFEDLEFVENVIAS